MKVLNQSLPNAIKVLTGIGFFLALTACGGGSSAPAAIKPVKAEPVAHETELLKLTLTPETETRLGITTVAIASGPLTRMLAQHGEIVVPGTGGGLPTSATTDLVTLAASQARADGDVARTREEFGIAQKTAARAEALLREEAGSIRSRDEALSALAVARANLATAEKQRSLLGSSVATMGRQGALWVRVPVFVGDLAELDQSAAASVHGFGSTGKGVSARPVNAPPSANPNAGTVDLYFDLANAGAGFRVGQRVAVDLPVKGKNAGLLVPASAILHDIYGGEWVYVLTAPHSYERRRIEVAVMEGNQAQLNRGLTVGTKVVTAGAAELFGTEFGAK